MNGITHHGTPITGDPRLFEYHALVCIATPGVHDGSMGRLLITVLHPGAHGSTVWEGLVEIEGKEIWVPIRELLLIEWDEAIAEQRRKLYADFAKEQQKREWLEAKRLERSRACKGRI